MPQYGMFATRSYGMTQYGDDGKPKDWHCRGCGQRFKRKDVYVQHVRKEHPHLINQGEKKGKGGA